MVLSPLLFTFYLLNNHRHTKEIPCVFKSNDYSAACIGKSEFPQDTFSTLYL